MACMPPQGGAWVRPEATRRLDAYHHSGMVCQSVEKQNSRVRRAAEEDCASSHRHRPNCGNRLTNASVESVNNKINVIVKMAYVFRNLDSTLSWLCSMFQAGCAAAKQTIEDLFIMATQNTIYAQVVEVHLSVSG